MYARIRRLYTPVVSLSNTRSSSEAASSRRSLLCVAYKLQRGADNEAIVSTAHIHDEHCREHKMWRFEAALLCCLCVATMLLPPSTLAGTFALYLSLYCPLSPYTPMYRILYSHHQKLFTHPRGSASSSRGGLCCFVRRVCITGLVYAQLSLLAACVYVCFCVTVQPIIYRYSGWDSTLSPCLRSHQLLALSDLPTRACVREFRVFPVFVLKR